MQSDGTGCCKILGLFTRLGLAGPKLYMPITEHDCSESNDGNDMCDRLISTKKKHLMNAVSSCSDCKTANDAANMLESISTLKSN